MYDNVVSEDVPDDFMSFLEKADERLGGGDKPASASEPGGLAPKKPKA